MLVVDDRGWAAFGRESKGSNADEAEYAQQEICCNDQVFTTITITISLTHLQYQHKQKQKQQQNSINFAFITTTASSGIIIMVWSMYIYRTSLVQLYRDKGL